MSEFKHQKKISAAQVARRSLILASVAFRGYIENNLTEPETPELYVRLLRWLERFDLWSEVQPDEEQIIRTPLGQLTQNEMVLATWRVEGLAILSWALKQTEFPRHDQEVDPPDTADAVWFLNDEVHHFIQKVNLRSPIQLKAGRELLYAIHTRLGQFKRKKSNEDFTPWVEKSWIKALGIDPAHLIVQNDLAIDDKPLIDMDYDRMQECIHIAFERHRAIIWLLGEYPIYSQTPVDI